MFPLKCCYNQHVLMKYLKEHPSKNNFLGNDMQKKCYFHYFYHKCMKDIANDRLVANEKSQLDSLENNGSSPQNKRITA